MELTDYIAYFFAGAFLVNATPHLVSGLMGHPFQTPFAKPPGEGLSTSTVNVAWGLFNLVVAYFLFCHVGSFEMRNLGHAGSAFIGALMMSLRLASHFGRFHGGNAPDGVDTSDLIRSTESARTHSSERSARRDQRLRS